MRKDTKSDEYKPTTTQKKLLKILLNPEYSFLNITKTCMIAEISRKAYYAAMASHGFVAYYKKRSVDLFSHAVGPIVHAVIREAKAGNFQQQKIILEKLGIHVDTKNHRLTGADGGPIETKSVKMTPEEIEKEMLKRGIPIPE